MTSLARNKKQKTRLVGLSLVCLFLSACTPPPSSWESQPQVAALFPSPTYEIAMGCSTTYGRAKEEALGGLAEQIKVSVSVNQTSVEQNRNGKVSTYEDSKVSTQTLETLRAVTFPKEKTFDGNICVWAVMNIPKALKIFEGERKELREKIQRTLSRESAGSSPNRYRNFLRLKSLKSKWNENSTILLSLGKHSLNFHGELLRNLSHALDRSKKFLTFSTKIPEKSWLGGEIIQGLTQKGFREVLPSESPTFIVQGSLLVSPLTTSPRKVYSGNFYSGKIQWIDAKTGDVLSFSHYETRAFGISLQQADKLAEISFERRLIRPFLQTLK